MPEDKEKKVFSHQRRILGKVPPLLALGALYFFFKGSLAWSGCFMIIAGVLNALAGLPYTMLLILIGLQAISLAYKKIVLMWVITIVLGIIASLDLMPLFRIRGKRWDNRAEHLTWLKENEVTYKLWKKLRHRHKQDSE